MHEEVSNGQATYASGAKRTALGARWDLLSPVGLHRAAKAAEEGVKKYGEYNHERGLAVNVYLNHLIAHAYAYLSGDRSEDHLGHMAWNALFACQSEEVYPELNAGHQRLPGCLPPKKEDIQ
jgi:hypothetical protein